MSDKDEVPDKVKQWAQDEGVEIAGAVSIPFDDNDPGAKEIHGGGEGDRVGEIPVPQMALQKICAQIWNAYSTGKREGDAQDMTFEVALNAYAYGYIQGRHEGIKESKRGLGQLGWKRKKP